MSGDGEHRRTRDDVPEWWLDAMSLPREQLHALEDAETPREPGWREGPNLDLQSDYAWALEHFRGERIDPGIAHVVRLFMEHGIETRQSCQGGDGHAYPYPTVDIGRQPWKALDVANDYGMPVMEITRSWRIEDGCPEDHPTWSIVFHPRRLAELREAWNAQEVRDREEFLRWREANAPDGADARTLCTDPGRHRQRPDDRSR